MTYNYTDNFRLVLEFAIERAKALYMPEVTPDLLIYSILHQDQSLLELLKQRGIETEFLLENYSKQIPAHLPSLGYSAPKLSNSSRIAISEAVKKSQLEQNGKPVAPIHLLEVFMESKEDTYLKRLLLLQDKLKPKAENLDQSFVNSLKKALDNFVAQTAKDMGQDDEESENDEDGQQQYVSHGKRKEKGGLKTPMLNRFGRDITALAREKKLDPVVGREAEVERMCQILGRRRKRNPILIGEPGVGKTSLVEGLSQRIVDQDVPPLLLGKRIVELDLSAMLAGTKYRGQFEERIKGLIEELEGNNDIILYIDEIHTMVGAGGGAMDAANMLKPALARGEILCIGATTIEEYRKHIEKDGALERRFQKILVEPSDKGETLSILKQLRERYEEYHQVRFTEKSLEAIVNLSDRYVNDRYFPDKAIDLMDETGARFASKVFETETTNPLRDLEIEHQSYIDKKLSAIKEQKYELAASYRNKERELEAAIVDAKSKLKIQTIASYPEILPEHIAEVLSSIISIPIKLNDGDLDSLRNLEISLKNKIIAQDSVVEKVVKSIKRNRLGLRGNKRPIGSFLFLGSTGVGKTYFVKTLAEELFGTSDSLIRVDMSEYMEKFAVSRLIGAPPGYVGHDDGGQLTEQVRLRPYSIVLFDEIEKAHSDVYNILLQILDEGYLTDSYGRKVDFRNTIIVITSNVGSREAKNFSRGIGYDHGGEHNRTEEIIKKSLHKTFSPEFLNRLDEILTFKDLDKDAIRSILALELKELNVRFKELGYTLKLDKKATEQLVENAYSPEYGARPLRRVLQTEIENLFTELILEGTIQTGDIVTLTAKEQHLELKNIKRK